MRAGQIVRSGTPAQIVADHPSEISFATPGATLPAMASGRVSHDGSRTTVHVDDLQTELTELLRWAETYDVQLDRLSARTATLESVFLEIADASGPYERDPAEPTPLTLEGSDR
jgi:ABC-2 type transport system ATP-binding protein